MVLTVVITILVLFKIGATDPRHYRSYALFALRMLRNLRYLQQNRSRGLIEFGNRLPCVCFYVAFSRPHIRHQNKLLHRPLGRPFSYMTVAKQLATRILGRETEHTEYMVF